MDHTELTSQSLSEITQGFDVDVQIEVSETEDEIRATIVGDDAALLIGHHGATLDAIQHLVSRIVFRGQGERKRILLDAAGYREKRAASLQRTADHAAVTVAQTHEPITLEAMSAAERRLVHEYLKGRVGIETYSEGDEPDRHLVVAPLINE